MNDNVLNIITNKVCNNNCNINVMRYRKLININYIYLQIELLNPVNTKNKTIDKFIICLHQIGLNYDEILDKYLVLILFLFPNLSLERKIQALEIIRLRCQTRKDTIFDELKGKELEGLLKNRY